MVLPRRCCEHDAVIHHRIRVPEDLAASHRTHFGEPGQAWITGFAQYVVDPEDPFPEGFTVGDIWG